MNIYPPCSSLIDFEVTEGTGSPIACFQFDASDLQANLEQQLNDGAALDFDTHEILGWLQSRGASNTTSTPVPIYWQTGFMQIAYQLAKKGLGTVRCGQCALVVATADAVFDENYQVGHTLGSQICCPAGHALLTIEIMRLILRPGSEPDPDGQ